MSKDKYPSMFFPQLVAIVFIILQIFLATHAVLKIGEYLTIIIWFYAHVCVQCGRNFCSSVKLWPKWQEVVSLTK